VSVRRAGGLFVAIAIAQGTFHPGMLESGVTDAATPRAPSLTAPAGSSAVTVFSIVPQWPQQPESKAEKDADVSRQQEWESGEVLSAGTSHGQKATKPKANDRACASATNER
jgi:hypothetical protein